MSEEPPVRMIVFGCDFLIEKSKAGWEINVRKSRDAVRMKIAAKRSKRDAESFALDWAHRENVFCKRGRPSQLAKPRKERIMINE